MKAILEKIRHHYSRIGKIKKNLFALLLMIINTITVILLFYLYETYKINSVEEKNSNYSIILEQANYITDRIIWDYMTNSASLATIDRDIDNILIYSNNSYTVSEEYMKKYAIYKKLEKLKLEDEYIDSVYLFGLNNDLIITDKCTNNMLDTFADREFYNLLKQQIQKNEFYNNIYLRKPNNISNVNITSNQEVVSFAYPIYQVPRQGVVVFNVKIERFREVVKNLGKQIDGFFLMFDSNNNLITSFNNTNIDINIKDFTEKLPSDSDYFEFKINDEKMSVFYNRNSVGWSLVQIIPYNTLFEKVFMFRDTLLLAGFLTFLLSIIISLILSFYLYKPVKNLINAVKYNGYNENTGLQADEFKFFENAYNTLIERNVYFNQRLIGYKSLLNEIHLYNIIRGKLPSDANLGREMEELGIPVHSSHLCCAILQIDNSFHYKSIYNIKEQEEHIRYITGVVKQVSSNSAEVISHMTEKNIIIILHDVSIPNIAGLVKMLERIRYEIETGKNLSVTIGLGSIVNDIRDLKNSYADADNCIRYKVIAGGGKVITVEDISYNEGFAGMEPEIKNQLFHAVKNLNCEESMDLLEKCLGKICFNPRIEDSVGLIISQVLNIFNDLLEEIHIQPPEYSDFNVYSIIEKYETIQQIEKWLQLKMMDTIHYLEQYMENKNSAILKQITEWIEENYQNPDLQLITAAEHFGFSPNYFGKLFNKLTKSTFNQYINELRLSKALELLNNTEEKVIQISKSVGFCSTQYFIKVFKAKYGITPGTKQRNQGFVQ